MEGKKKVSESQREPAENINRDTTSKNSITSDVTTKIKIKLGDSHLSCWVVESTMINKIHLTIKWEK